MILITQIDIQQKVIFFKRVFYGEILYGNIVRFVEFKI